MDVLIPALSDDPESIEELQHAMRRFMPPEEDGDMLARWAAGVCDAPFEAGICLVDLIARLIVYQSTDGVFQRDGKVTCDIAEEYPPKRARWIPYHLAGDMARDAAARRLGVARLPAPAAAAGESAVGHAAVLYGRVVEFIVEECFAARGGATGPDGTWTPPAAWQWRNSRSVPLRAHRCTCRMPWPRFTPAG